MTQSLLASAMPTLKRVGPGHLFMVPAPSTDPGTTTGLPTGDTTAQEKTIDGYYALFFGAAGAAAKQALQAGMADYATLDNTGMDLKLKPSTVKFDQNLAPQFEMTTGLESATAEFTYFEVEPAHLVDLFGSQASDLITVVAATGVAARQIALLGSQSYNLPATVLYRIASSRVAGTFFHYLLPQAYPMANLELKLSKKDELKAKVQLQLQPSPFLLNSAGNGVVVITDDPTAPAQA